MGLLNTSLVSKALSTPWLVSVLQSIVPPLDRFLLRATRGWVNTAMQTVVLLETTGAKSGQSRTTVTLCVPDGRDVLLVGSNWGRDKHPAWVFNLRANPRARMTFRGYRGPVDVTELTGQQRQDAWPKLVAHNPQYQVYQDNTSRELPVLRLKRSTVGR